MRSSLMVICGLLAAMCAPDVAIAQERPVERAFQHYERIRAALAQDTTSGIEADAKALSPLAAEVAGDTAGRAAESLAQAKDLDEARELFGALSDALVPAFVDARIPDVQAFICPMNKKRWAQRGTRADNPYYGKAMATCGTALKGEGGH